VLLAFGRLIFFTDFELIASVVGALWRRHGRHGAVHRLPV
jgi:hypothetical protein